MLDRWPTVLREPLWALKHRVVAQLTRLGLVESFHVSLQKQLHSLSPSVVLDVGANDGSYIHLVRRLGYQGPIYAFEPLPQKRGVLEERARRDGRLTILPYALGDAEETMVLRVSREDVFSSFMPPTICGQQMFPTMHADRTAQVTIHRANTVLPSLIANLEMKRVHLKLDTQGFDLKVLSGFDKLLSCVVSLQVELSIVPIYEGQPSYLDTLAVLSSYGFIPTCFYPVSRQKDLALIELDALFIRRS